MLIYSGLEIEPEGVYITPCINVIMWHETRDDQPSIRKDHILTREVCLVLLAPKYPLSDRLPSYAASQSGSSPPLQSPPSLTAMPFLNSLLRKVV